MQKDPLLEDFKIIRIIDKGSFGKVFLVVNQHDNRKYAMKRIRKDVLLNKKQVENTKTERDILLTIEHPFLLSMDYVFQNEFRLYFLLDFIDGGNLYDHLYRIRRFPEPQVAFIAAQIALALGFLHEKLIIHRDLKPENVLMDEDGYIRLADFGFCKPLQRNDDTTESFCGTAEYIAPEILFKRAYSYSVDWWTFGVLIYEMALGRPPFLDKNHHRLGVLIREGPIVFPKMEVHKFAISDELTDLISRLLTRDPAKRIGSTNGVEEIKQHPFFKDIDFEKLQNKALDAPYKPDMEDMRRKGKPVEQAAKEAEFEAAESLIDKKFQKLVTKNQAKFEGF